MSSAITTIIFPLIVKNLRFHCLIISFTSWSLFSKLSLKTSFSSFAKYMPNTFNFLTHLKCISSHIGLLPSTPAPAQKASVLSILGFSPEYLAKTPRSLNSALQLFILPSKKHNVSSAKHDSLYSTFRTRIPRILLFSRIRYSKHSITIKNI